MGEATFRQVAALEHASDDELEQPLASSPLQPFWLNESDSLLFYRISKSACIFGLAHGEGFLISRLPSEHPTLIKWSAPAFLKIRLASVGLSLGHQTLHSFTACMSSATRNKLYQQGSRSVTGLEAALSCGGLQHKADLIAVPQDEMKTAGFQIARGLLLDLSFAVGSMQVDDAKNAVVYGEDATALRILHGGIEPPREMQPLYGCLNSVVSTVERVTPPARVSASLERYSTGIDPERRIVLKDGTVLYGDPSLRGAGKKHR